MLAWLALSSPFVKRVQRNLAIATGALLGTVIAVPLSAHAQADLSGTWKIARDPSSIVGERGALPFTQEGAKRYKENMLKKAKKDFEFDLTTTHCSAPGVPRIMLTSQRFRIFQDPHIIMIGFEWNRFRRVIEMPTIPPQLSFGDERENAKLVGTKMGTSRGRWEGDTLVVVTDQFSDNTLIDGVVPHSFDLKITERIRLKDGQMLEDRVTIEDPEIFIKPWEVVLIYTRQPDAIFPEDACLDRVQGEPALPTQ
ncbi:hypothetical protein WSK_4050 [Novosphingobium sp. Rr 2-17]|uniref:hypothetical protein n=1 Tax=Novosphingobium sp. Rr 2-17 TaxID=555793 RepID=UPI0002699C1D|nr:hypothetical protein [Novosphingobium sp. Rr 2-17]EIZ77388.1 hypothetical protein WSK_4050 [Novosphingobium sp. Rr 2-17]